MHIRTALLEDLPFILPIYADARVYMRENGNPHQWAGIYPDEATLRDDFAKQQLFVCVENDRIVGVFCYFFGNEPTYDRIYEGAWLNDRPYGVLHRIAVAAHRRGVASHCFDFCLSQCKSLKIDTHRDNIPMQKSLAKNGFSYCGIIYLASGDERLAYQKLAE